MQYQIVAPSRLCAEIHLPASKSICNRAQMIQALAGGSATLANLSACDDTRAMSEALALMPDVIDVGAAGTAMRFMTAYLCVTPGQHTITGSERMRERPIRILVDALRLLGADIRYEGREGFPPLHITGRPLCGGEIEVAGDTSSQYISALLMIGPMLSSGLTLHLTGHIISRPYIDLTLWTMAEHGASAEWTDVDTITVEPRPYQPRPYTIESDWSASSYWYAMMALSGDPEARITLPGLGDNSRQGDSIARYIASLLGVKTTFSAVGGQTAVTLTRHTSHLPRLDYDFTNSPDLAQTFVVACAARGIPFHFTGLATLRIKETDRIRALTTELLKLGCPVQAGGDDGSDLIWDGTRVAPTMEPIATYEDHRMAMAFAPAAFVFPGLTIDHPEVVSKSYPHFWDDLRTAGFTITASE